MNAEQAARLKQTIARYEERHQRFAADAEALDARAARIGNFRGLSFLLLVSGLIYWASSGSLVGPGIAAVGLLVFAALVRHHAQVIADQERAERFSLVNQQGLLRLTNQWQSLPRSGINFAPEEHTYAADLDLFGSGSLYQRLSVAHTRFGQATFAQWLANPAEAGDISARQEAVAELAEEREFREHLEALGMALVEKKRSDSTRVLSDGPNPHRLLSWAKTPEPAAQSVVLTVASFVLPLASFAGIVAQVVADQPPYYWFGPVALSLVVLSLSKTTSSAAFAAVSTTEGAFLRYGDLLSLLESHEGQAEWFQARKQRLLGASQQRPSDVMRRFRNIVSWFDLRHNGMVYPFVNAFLLWDVHCTRALENWKRDSGSALTDWFTVIGEYEALSSLAGLLADDPAATLPVLSPRTEPTLEAEALAHPLLPATTRVENDLSPLAPGQALLVTGSNMSGKSTFLRALGVNCVLALCGGPVIARRFALPSLQLGTSLRIADSLGGGVSHFYAEVQKLAQVTELAAPESTPVLFLLDEVLHGTNSRERQIGARWVLAELLERGAFGIVTTHDMELCQLPEPLMQHVRQHHFRELVEDGEMTFDYKLRSGPVTSGNALRLMRRVGLNVPLED